MMRQPMNLFCRRTSSGRTFDRSHPGSRVSAKSAVRVSPAGSRVPLVANVSPRAATQAARARELPTARPVER